MDDKTALDLLGVLAAAFPTFPLDDETGELWVGKLRSFDADDAYEAVVDWVDDNDRFPTIHQLDSAVRDVMHRAREADRSGRAAQPMLDGQTPDEARVALAVEIPRAMRQAVAEAGVGGTHRGHRWLDSSDCPVCVSAPVRAAAVRDRFEELVAPLRRQLGSAPGRRYGCECGEGRGHVTETTGLRPCRACSFEAWALWRHRLTHRRGVPDCGECASPKLRRKIAEAAVLAAQAGDVPEEAF